jgi:hypothetical protein
MALENGKNTEGSARGVYNPVTLINHEEENGPLQAPLVRLFVALLFATIFAASWKRPEFIPASIAVLAGCLLYRLDRAQRKLAAAPLILAAVRLCMVMPGYLGLASGMKGYFPPSMPIETGNWSSSWIPLFLSVCLFYLPKKDSVTLKIVGFEAVAVILSSLLPEGGFAVVLMIFNATLFFAIAIGLLLDLKPELFESRHYVQAPIRVHIPATPPPPRPVV